jgi:hypothetical protein
MLRIDLLAARDEWIKEAMGDLAESQRRRESKFLCPEDDSAQVIDFHALRHTFVSNLATGGVHPKVAQQLARHSTITLTMDRYSHLALIDLTAGISTLPTLAGPEMSKNRATGTDNMAATDDCTNGCTHPTEINQNQPLSTHPTGDSATNGKTHDSKPKRLKIMGNSEVHPWARTSNLRFRRLVRFNNSFPMLRKTPVLQGFSL